jgi:hypothetical protein
VVEIYREPEGGTFRVTERAGRGRSVTPLAFADTPLAVADILG